MRNPANYDMKSVSSGGGYVVFKYTQELQQFLHAKTEPQPWLHVVNIRTPLSDYWAIYVWDTRKVVEEGSDYRPWPKAPKAFDNHKMLEGTKNLNIAAAFDERWVAINNASHRSIRNKEVLEVFKDKASADAWYAEHRKAIEDLNKERIKVIAECDKAYRKEHSEWTGRGAIPEELMRMEHEATEKLYKGHEELRENADIKSAKWLAQYQPELYKKL